MKKCAFLAFIIHFLRFIISKDCVPTNPNKVKAIRELFPPHTIHEDKSFHGLAIFFIGDSLGDLIPS